MLDGSCSVSASVNSSQRPRALCTANQHAFDFPVNTFVSSRGALSTTTPACSAAARSAIARVPSADSSSTISNSQSRPTENVTASSCASNDARQPPSTATSFLAGTITESSKIAASRPSASAAATRTSATGSTSSPSGDERRSGTGSYYRNVCRSMLCNEQPSGRHSV